LVTFLEHSYRVSSLKKSIKEQASEVFGRVILTESNQDLTPLKPLIKQYLKEGLWDNFTDWVSDTAKSTVKGVKDFAVDSWEGLKEFGVAISKGDWNEIVSLMGRGVKWLARKLRQAIYSPVGLIVDAILVATGVGATVKDFAEAAFSHAGLNWQDHIEVDQKYIRPTEVDALIGDPSKATKELNWKATTHWKELAGIMVDADIAAK
jgi:hypothetical protein